MIELLKDAFHLLSDVQGLVQWGGMVLVCTIVFVETGLFFGFFLPGDSLLIPAGIFCAAGHLHLGWLLSLVPLLPAIIEAMRQRSRRARETAPVNLKILYPDLSRTCKTGRLQVI